MRLLYNLNGRQHFKKSVNKCQDYLYCSTLGWNNFLSKQFLNITIFMRYPWNFCYYDKTKIEQKMSWELGHDNIEIRMLLQKAFQPISWLKLDSLQNKSWIRNLSYLSREKQCYIKTRLLIEKRVHPIALWLKPSEKDSSNCTLAQTRRMYK